MPSSLTRGFWKVPPPTRRRRGRHEGGRQCCSESNLDPVGPWLGLRDRRAGEHAREAQAPTSVGCVHQLSQIQRRACTCVSSALLHGQPTLGLSLSARGEELCPLHAPAVAHCPCWRTLGCLHCRSEHLPVLAGSCRVRVHLGFCLFSW